MYQPDARCWAYENDRGKEQIDLNGIQGNGAPKENLKRQFDQIDRENEPGCRANKSLLRQLHGQKENGGSRPRQIAKHSSDSC